MTNHALWSIFDMAYTTRPILIDSKRFGYAPTVYGSTSK